MRQAQAKLKTAHKIQKAVANKAVALAAALVRKLLLHAPNKNTPSL